MWNLHLKRYYRFLELFLGWRFRGWRQKWVLGPCSIVWPVFSIPMINGGPSGPFGIAVSRGSDMVGGVPEEQLSWGIFLPYLASLSHSQWRKVPVGVKG
ncbi:hypothetical protein KI387_041021, partial [Taxus chinensis]